MSETTQLPIEPTTTDSATELATLRKVNAEIVLKRQRDKERLAQMEVDAIAMQAKVSAAEAAVTEASVGIPLRILAEDISITPFLWLETLGKHFTVTSKDGKLSIQTLTGEPLKDAKGEVVKVNRTDLARYLTETEPESERTKVFRAITIVSRASGGDYSRTNKSSGSRSESAPRHQFGLR